MTDAPRDLRALIALAKRMPHVESTRRDAASFASFESRLFAKSRKPRVRAIWLAAGLSTCAALVVAYPIARERGIGFGSFMLGGGAAQLSYREQPIALASGQFSLAPGTGRFDEAGAGRELAFSDGSRVQLSQESTANVAEVTDRGARVVLKRGRAEVSIARRKQAAWQMVAGPYTVKVTGTAFRLAWSPDTQEFELAMHHGSVIVSGPMAEQGVALGKGQRLVGSPRSRRLVVEEWRGDVLLARAAEAPAPVAEVEQLATSESGNKNGRNVLLARGTARFDDRARVLAHGWAKQVAQGQFESVLAEARRIGHSRVLSAANVSDLGALADAARYARQDALGQKTLLALRERFPDSEQARDTAFLLGRLSKEQRALEWYERYLSEQPKGAYVSQALGRSMMLCFELGDRARAKALALRYLARFPGGPYAASARKLSDSSVEARGSAREQKSDREPILRNERADSSAP